MPKPLSQEKLWEKVQEAKNYLVAHANKADLDHFALVLEDGEICYYPNSACYAAMEYGAHTKPGMANPAYFVIWHSRETEDSEAMSAYLKWLTKVSPFKEVYIDATAKSIVAEPTVLRCDISPQRMISAAIAIRYRVEHISIVQRWFKLKQYMSRDLAFLFAHLFSGAHNAKSYNVTRGEIGHGAVCAYWLGTQGFNNFLSHTPVQGDQLVSKKYFRYRGLIKAWNNGKQGTLSLPKTTKKVNGYNIWGDAQDDKYLLDKMRSTARSFLKLNGITITHVKA